jgi:hypothetical protein
MVEIWIAIATLLDFLRDETERARRFGIFASIRGDDVDSGIEKLLLSTVLSPSGFSLSYIPHLFPLSIDIPLF